MSIFHYRREISSDPYVHIPLPQVDILWSIRVCPYSTTPGRCPLVRIPHQQVDILWSIVSYSTTAGKYSLFNMSICHPLFRQSIFFFSFLYSILSFSTTPARYPVFHLFIFHYSNKISCVPFVYIPLLQVDVLSGEDSVQKGLVESVECPPEVNHNM